MMLGRSDVLEWGTFCALLARFAQTPYGRDQALTLIPSTEGAVARLALAETRQARGARATAGEPPWAGVADVRAVLARVEPEGATLDGGALVALGRTLGAAGRIAGYVARIAPVAADLVGPWQDRPLCLALGARLDHDLDPEGGVRDAASATLARIRRRLATLRATIQGRLDALLASPTAAGALQERYVTLRNGRWVVPVRVDARQAVRGIVHDRSASGATLFIEPEAVVELNNQLTRELREAEDEEHRVLGELTREVRVQRPALDDLVLALGALDLAFARAALADRLDAVEPELDDQGELDVRGARHPLLVAQSWQTGIPVVPIDLYLPRNRPGLLITGPNAGGKTVALQTCGLLVLMAQAGCHIPARTPSRLPICDRVLAVIGDEQSLAQSLSTFSAFVQQMREILDVATTRSLVLLDELGAGTDPSEGAALGAALIEALLDRGARVVATTHLEPLKVFAQVEPRVENATVAFDPERLAPTFQLEYGHPGPSYALTIATRLGLPAAIVARAEAHLGEERQRLDTLLAELIARERDAQARLAAAERREREGRAAAEAAEAARARAAGEAERHHRETLAQARALLGEARQRAGRELDRLKDAAGDRPRTREVYERLRALEAELLPPPAPAAADPVGAGLVELRGLGLRGRVVAENGDELTVQAGRLTVRVARTAVTAAAGPAPAIRPAPVPVTPARQDVPRELHLRGQTTEEARGAVDKFLDDALLAGHPTVRLIHGKGTGALRRAVETCLREHPLVTGFRLGAPAEGGGGVTVVDLAGGPPA